MTQARSSRIPLRDTLEVELADIQFSRTANASVAAACGRWVISELQTVDAALRQWRPAGPQAVLFDLGALERLDTAGAWILHRSRKQLRASGLTVDYANVQPGHAALLARVEANDRPYPQEPPPASSALLVLAEIGSGVSGAVAEARALLGFLGLMMATLGRAIVNPRRLRWTPLIYHLEAIGFNAVPIVSLISFLIGVVLAYQGATQLRQFGAEIFTVELVAISVLREIGILLTAIIVAGRSGSAFTAQIGSMKLNEEIDAMRTLALDPMEVLVLPRVLALIIALPMLGFIADIMGLFGGALMCWVVLDITPGLYLQRLNEWVPLAHFWVGLIKAPFFALMIGLIGCFEGLQVEGSAESVGRLTTKSVVEAIFMVIVVDAIFSIYFAVIGF
ncbi:MAG: MlaE family lipid ABC transporter permease subunit [Alphaproteobacteria bacterium]